MNKYLSLLLLSVLFLLNSCKREGDIEMFDNTKEWKVKSYIIRSTDQNTGAVINDVKTNFQYFRMKDTANMDLGGYYQKYTGTFFEIESYVDSTLTTKSKTFKQTFWSGSKNDFSSGVEPYFSEQTDQSGTTIKEVFTMNYSNSNNTWNLYPATDYSMMIRKINNNKLRVIITKLGGQGDMSVYQSYNETILELEK